MQTIKTKPRDLRAVLIVLPCDIQYNIIRANRYPYTGTKMAIIFLHTRTITMPVLAFTRCYYITVIENIVNVD